MTSITPDARRGMRNSTITTSQSQTAVAAEVVVRRQGSGPCVAEAAGQMTADCAAVCCCCSFGLINLFYFCLIKLPTGLLLRSARRLRRRTKKKTKKSALLYSIEEEEIKDQDWDESVVFIDFEPTKDDLEFTEEMWENLMNSGFGRSLSRRYEQPAKFCSS